ncbi:hypothetical protein AB0B78_14900 [Streptomyces sp. NPDC040724]|uniref:hypothetical protein n=1 Tax=unclassified Streptomyces TaxID=2593676 RepID=UPI00340D8CC0
MLEVAQAVLNSGMAFFWDEVLGEYIAGLLVALTIGAAGRTYRRRRHRQTPEGQSGE